MKRTVFTVLWLLALAGCGPDTLIVKNESDTNIVGVCIDMAGPELWTSNMLASVITPGEMRGWPWPLEGEAAILIFLDPDGLADNENLPLLLEDLIAGDFAGVYSNDFGSAVFQEGRAMTVMVVGSEWNYEMALSYQDAKQMEATP